MLDLGMEEELDLLGPTGLAAADVPVSWGVFAGAKGVRCAVARLGGRL